MKLARTAGRIGASLALLLALLLATAAAAQVPTPDNHVDGGQLGVGTRWRVVRAPHFNVVFPRGMEIDAQRVAAMLERSRAAEGFSIGGPPAKLTVVLQHKSTLSNAFVTLAPRYSEYVVAPPDFSVFGADDWLTLLVIHETRHVAQFDQTKVGFTKFLYVLFGDFGQQIGTAFIPGWMFEGDAVGTETALTSGGRGRTASFTRGMRALALDDKLPEYYQAMTGSYTHNWPGPYEMGYLMTSRLKNTRPLGSVGRVFRGAARHSYLLPLAFPIALRREAGVWPGTLYDSTMREATALWRAQIEGLTFTPATRRSPPAASVFTSFFSPRFLGDGTVIALRSGFANITQIVRFDSGRVTVLADAPADAIRTAGSLVSWAQLLPDVRWGQINYVEIRVLDTRTGRNRRVGAVGRWAASPALSPDGTRIAAIETLEMGGSRIVVLDVGTGARVREYDVPGREHAMDPAWRADGGAVVFTRQGVAGKALTVLDLQSGVMTDLVPHGLLDLTQPAYAGNFVLYSSPYSGLDNIYAIDTRSGARWQVASRRIGATDPAVSPDAKRMLFGDSERMGRAVMEMPLDSATWTPIEQVERRPFSYHERLVEQERFVLPSAAIAADTATRYPVKGFGRPWQLFQVHTWSPVASNGEFGFSLDANDVLNTLATSLTYRYNTNEKGNSVTASASYGGFFPIIDIDGTIGTRSSFETVADTVATNSWTEKTIAVGVRLPLNFSRGYWGRGLSIGARVERSEISELTLPAYLPPGDGTFTPVTLGARFANRKGGALRDMATWGQFLSGQYRYTPFGGDFHPRRWDAHATLTSPGLIRHHGLIVSADVEENRGDGAFFFGTTMDRPRGYGVLLFDRHLVATRTDYAFPIAYPDFSLGPLVAVPRVTGRFFHDYFRASGSGAIEDMWSAGVELIPEWVPFGIGLYLPIGVRLAYRSADRKWVVQSAWGL